MPESAPPDDESPPPTGDDSAPTPDDALSSAANPAAAIDPALSLGLGVFAPEGEAEAPKAKSDRSEPINNPDQAADDRVIDGRLIDRTLAGDSTAFGELVQRHQDRLRNTLLRMTGSAEEAEDVAQEAFVQAYTKLDTFQRSSRFYTWLYRIAFNQAISKNRKRRPRVSLNAVQEAGGIEPEADGSAPADPVLTGERSELLHEAIAELAEDHRQVLVLREFEGCDYQQIAEVLEVPVGTVRSRLFRARAQLRDRLAPVLGESD